MNNFYLILIPILFLISKKISILLNLYDYPDNNRKIHSKPTLIVGGIFQILFYFIFYFF